MENKVYCLQNRAVVIKMFDQAYSEFLSAFGMGKPMVLSTCADDHVTSRMMSVVQLDGVFYFQTDRMFRKYEQLKANKNAALCIDNIQIEGVCEELGHPSLIPTFDEAYRKCFPGSHERYSRLANERVFALKPTFIERWVYKDGEPFVEIFDVERRGRKVEAYKGY